MGEFAHFHLQMLWIKQLTKKEKKKKMDEIL